MEGLVGLIKLVLNEVLIDVRDLSSVICRWILLFLCQIFNMYRTLCLFILSLASSFIVAQSSYYYSNSIQVKTNYRQKLVRNSLLAAASVGVAFALDQPMQNWMLGHQSKIGDGIADVANVLGEKKIMIPALGATLGVSYLIKDETLKRTSWNAVKAVAVTALATEGIKISAGRARPFMDEGPHSYQSFKNDDQYKSLPSGHTSLAFAIFTPYAETYSRWIYVLPASVGFARMYKNKHWFSDVVLGGSIGFISGWIFTHHPRKNIQVSANGVVVFF